MKYQPFAVLSFALALGIIMGYYFNYNQFWLWVMLGVCGIALILLKLLNIAPKTFTIFGLIAVSILGLTRYQQANPARILNPSKAKALNQVEIDAVYKPSEKYNKYKAKVIKSKDSAVINQAVLLYVKKSQPLLHVNDQALLYAKSAIIPSPKNPHTFNYKRFMQLKDVHLQSFADTLLKIEHPKQFSFAHLVSAFKSDIKHQLKEEKYSKAAQLFVSSLALGDRTNFDRETQDTLAAVGIVHLFAISGLHLGIMFTFIMVLLYPLLYAPKGRQVRIIAALLFIWLYAAFVDFTPSVTRAAFMISVYYITVLLQRPTNLIHTLFFTAFILLCINPNYLFDVGFQLSYAAVFFIAWLYEPLRNLLPKYRRRRYNYFFDLLAVTFSAQLGVMPISIFYFHQFSGLFIIGNLLMIPLALALVVGSIIVVIVVSLGWSFPLWVLIINTISDFLYLLIEKIATLDGLIIRDLSLTIIQLILCVVFVFLSRRILIQFKWRKVIPLLVLLFLFQVTRLYQQYKYQQKQELIVFNQYKGSIVGLRYANNLDVFWKVEDSIKAQRYVILPYTLAENIDHVQYFPLTGNRRAGNFIKHKNLIKWNNASFYIVTQHMDSLPNVDYIIGTQGKINTNTIISTQTKRVITDASNYPSVIKRLKENSAKIFATAQDGAYVFTIDSINHQTPHSP